GIAEKHPAADPDRSAGRAGGNRALRSISGVRRGRIIYRVDAVGKRRAILRLIPAARLNRNSFRRPSLWRQFILGKINAGRDPAANQPPVAGGLRRLPDFGWNYGLRTQTGGDIAAERNTLDAAGCRGDFKLQRRAGIPVPDFRCIEAMPMRALA